MFITNSEVGKIKTLARDASAIKGIITKGSRVEIITVGDRGYDLKDIESGEVVTEVSECFMFGDTGPLFED